MPRGRSKGTILGQYRVNYFPFCSGCGEQFAARRPDARTCSNKCRKRIYRHPGFVHPAAKAARERPV